MQEPRTPCLDHPCSDTAHIEKRKGSGVGYIHRAIDDNGAPMRFISALQAGRRLLAELLYAESCRAGKRLCDTQTKEQSRKYGKR